FARGVSGQQVAIMGIPDTDAALAGRANSTAVRRELGTVAVQRCNLTEPFDIPQIDSPWQLARVARVETYQCALSIRAETHERGRIAARLSTFWQHRAPGYSGFSGVRFPQHEPVNVVASHQGVVRGKLKLAVDAARTDMWQRRRRREI